MTDLFPDLPMVLSPRLAWMQLHDVSTCQLLADGQESPETGEEGPLWCAYIGEMPEASQASAARMAGRLVLATNEEAALERIAYRNRWELWK